MDADSSRCPSAATVDVRLLHPKTGDDQHSAFAEIRINGQSFVVYYKASEGPVSDDAVSYVVAAMLPAMRIGKPSRSVDPISPRLLNALPTIQAIYHSWEPQCTTIDVQAPARDKRHRSAQLAVGCFFSGGVDSFYTLLKHRDEITTLILVHGYDIRLNDRSLRNRVSHAVGEVADAFGKQVLEVETNVKTLSDHFSSWEVYHGLALAAG